MSITAPSVGRRRASRTRTALVVVGLLAATFGLAGCGGLVGSYIGTQQALRNAGFQSVSVHFHFASSGDRVGANVAVAAPPSPADVRDVAQVVWTHVQQRFSTLTVSVRGTGSGQGRVAAGTYSFEQLEQTFGPRNSSWNHTTLSASAEHVGYAVLGGIVLVIALVVVLVVVVSRRRRRAAWAAGGVGYGGASGVPMWPPPPGPPGPPAPEWRPPGPAWTPDPPPQAATGPYPSGFQTAPTAPVSAAPPAGPPPPPAPPAPAPPPPPAPPAPAPPAPREPQPAPPPPPSNWPRPADPTPPGDDGGWGPPTAPD